MASNNEQSAPVMVVAVPLPAQSHLNQLLDLSAFISSSYNLPVHYVCSSAHVRPVKLRYLNRFSSPKSNSMNSNFLLFLPLPLRAADLLIL
ncbi:hypothetical protein SLA2020_016310 [Shorea laevis]